MSWRSLPYLTGLCLGIFTISYWPIMRAPFWNPPEPTRWEYFTGEVATSADGYALVIDRDAFVALHCAPGLSSPWSCGAGYRSWMQAHARDRVTLGLAINKGLWGREAVLVEARTARGFVEDYGKLRLTAHDAIVNLFGFGWIYALVFAFAVVGMWVRSMDERRVAAYE